MIILYIIQAACRISGKVWLLPDAPLGEGKGGEVFCVLDQDHVHAASSVVIPDTWSDIRYYNMNQVWIMIMWHSTFSSPTWTLLESMLVMADSLLADSHLSSITFRGKGGEGFQPGHIALLLLLEQIMYKRLSVHLQLETEFDNNSFCRQVEVTTIYKNNNKCWTSVGKLR